VCPPLSPPLRLTTLASAVALLGFRHKRTADARCRLPGERLKQAARQLAKPEVAPRRDGQPTGHPWPVLLELAGRIAQFFADPDSKR
jgi:hypothetical protein